MASIERAVLASELADRHRGGILGWIYVTFDPDGPDGEQPMNAGGIWPQAEQAFLASEQENRMLREQGEEGFTHKVVPLFLVSGQVP